MPCVLSARCINAVFPMTGPNAFLGAAFPRPGPARAVRLHAGLLQLARAEVPALLRIAFLLPPNLERQPGSDRKPETLFE